MSDSSLVAEWTALVLTCPGERECARDGTIAPCIDRQPGEWVSINDLKDARLFRRRASLCADMLAYVSRQETRDV